MKKDAIICTTAQLGTFRRLLWVSQRLQANWLSGEHWQRSWLGSINRIPGLDFLSQFLHKAEVMLHPGP